MKITNNSLPKIPDSIVALGIPSVMVF